MKIRYICAVCGSDNVTANGVCAWNKEKQEWELEAMYDYDDDGNCNDCGLEVDLLEDIIE